MLQRVAVVTLMEIDYNNSNQDNHTQSRTYDKQLFTRSQYICSLTSHTQHGREILQDEVKNADTVSQSDRRCTSTI